jgi:hypothetical protein
MLNEKVQMTNTDNSPIPETERKETLVSIAQAMVQNGCDAEAVFAALININQRRCRPPLDYEQLRDIAHSIAQALNPREEGILLEGDFPDQVADAFLTSGPVRLYHHADMWTVLQNHRYELMDMNEVRKWIYQFGSSCKFRRRFRSHSDDILYDRLRVTPRLVSEVLESLSASPVVWIRKQDAPPAWLKDTGNRPHPDNIIALHNALIDCSGDQPVRLDPTDDFFTLTYLPIKYDSNAVCPLWLEKLGQWFTELPIVDDHVSESDKPNQASDALRKVPDQRSIGILQEWFGYALTRQARYPNILGLTGPARSGKGVITKILHALAGCQNTASPTLSSLAGKEGLRSLDHKCLAFIHYADLRRTTAETRRAVHRLYSIAGQKSWQRDRIDTRFVLVSDFLSQLIDPTGLLAGRIICLQTTQSFYGREDIHLGRKLLNELPGIFNWAMEGFFRLKKRGFFLESTADQAIRIIAQEQELSVSDFVNECCRLDSQAHLRCQNLYDGYNRWITQEGLAAMGRTQFYGEFQRAFPACSRFKVRLADSGENPVWIFNNIDWRPGYELI